MTVKMKNQSLKVKYMKINGYSLLNIRLWWYSLSLIHLVVTAVVTLSIDVTVDEDPLVRAYNHVRWKLITAWFNMVALAYLPLCLYCDWCEKLGYEPIHVQSLRVLRDVVMTSILMPITTFSDLTFWMLFNNHASVIAPPRVFEYCPLWAQHSLHTVSMITAIMDLLLTPRRRPDSMKPGLVVMMGFATTYSLMVYVSLLQGEPVYAFLSTASATLIIAVCVCFHVVLTICYYAQWQLIDYVWGRKGINLSKKMVKKISRSSMISNTSFK